MKFLALFATAGAGSLLPSAFGFRTHRPHRACVRLSALDESIASSAADAVLLATMGLDRGVAASRAEVERVENAIADFEAVAPATSLKGADLLQYLDGTWRLVFSSSLVERSSATAEDLRRFVTTVVDLPTARSSRVALGEVSQKVDGPMLEESVRLRLRVPWPLPAAPDLMLKIVSQARDRRGRRRGLRDIEAGSQALSVSAASSTVRVTRSALGEVRVFVRTASADGDAKGTVMGAVAAPEAAALAGNTTSVANRTDASAVTAARVAVLGPQALREIARARQEMAAEAAAALETLKAKAAEAAASEKEELTETYERLRAEAAQVAEAELDRQRELFEAKTAAATAVAAAELADALSQAEERLAAAKAAAAEESETLAREAAEALKTAQARAAAEVEAAKLALEMGRIKAEEELAMARSAFLAEKQELVKSLREAEERAEKAKKAAIAAIGNL
ncbi:hypothetical protein Ctob_007586 [Chrysochromulina tobinii]|uniref:Plastid lipid-associated protein/fibrillin conserved domain-containing protein n=1 Tax=Chrysochromulina tobinii TaxID=1460289 RepID=A0A0M0JMA1_9EUKA|nr:hypothetical protein Ctob_007586 [Chrysochromulina tobinii]|eukprot:KOO27709.1 hypothetical protein Ctob_007586 [Chrysochromulina sp. CCMP291]